MLEFSAQIIKLHPVPGSAQIIFLMLKKLLGARYWGPGGPIIIFWLLVASHYNVRLFGVGKAIGGFGESPTVIRALDTSVEIH